MLEFCRKQTSSRQGQIKIGISALVFFLIATVVGLTFVAEPYAVYATGEKVEEPWLVSVDGTPVAVVESREAGESVETGLRVYYGGDSFDEQNAAEIENTITVTKYAFDDASEHPVVMSGAEVVAFIVRMNSESETPLVSVVTTVEKSADSSIAYESKTIESADYDKGTTTIKTAGQDGTKRTVTLYTLVSGKVKASEILSEQVTKEPVTEVIIKGTKEEEEEVAETASTRTSSSSSSASTSSSSSSSYVPAVSASSTDLVSYALQFVGCPYVYGGSTPSGWDCSGFTMYVYGKYGVSLSHSSYAQGAAGYAVPNGQQQPGDLVCYGGHVGIYIGNGQLVHASTYGVGTIVSSLSYRSGYWFRRVL